MTFSTTVTMVFDKNMPTALIGSNSLGLSISAPTSQLLLTPLPINQPIESDFWIESSTLIYLDNSVPPISTFTELDISDTKLVEHVAPIGLHVSSPVTSSLTVTNVADIGQLVLGDVIPVPVRAAGTPADKRGMVRVDEEFMYYCVEDYDGERDIWKSTPLAEFKRSFTRGSMDNSIDRYGRPGDKLGDFKLELSGGSEVNVYFCVESYDPAVSQIIWYNINIPPPDLSLAGVGYPRNTAIGDGTKLFNGSDNTGVGYLSLGSVYTGVANTAVGSSALSNLSNSNYNTGVGARALTANTVGSNNTGIGSEAIMNNTTGVSNSALGNSALKNNTIGSYNTGVGSFALFNNTDGEYNFAAGFESMRDNTVGMYNAAVGANALNSNQTGNQNTGVGNGSLYNNGHGHNNTGIGASALLNTTGNGNIGIGALTESGLHAPAFDITNQSNYISMGSTSVTNAYIQVAWTIASDARDKTDFAEIPHGLEFIKQLKPVAYRYKPTRDATSGHGPVRYGFRAQDVLVLEGDAPVIVDATDQDRLRFNDQSLIAVMSKAIQEQQTIIDSLNTRILALEGK